MATTKKDFIPPPPKVGSAVNNRRKSLGKACGIIFVWLIVFFFSLGMGKTFVWIVLIAAAIYIIGLYLRRQQIAASGGFVTGTIPSIKTNMHMNKRFVGISVGIIVVIILLFKILVVIPAGMVGVYHIFGKVDSHELSPGLHVINPLGAVDKMSTRTEQYTMSIMQEEGNRAGDDSITALTKEGLEVKLDITVLYHLNSEKASDMFSTVGKNYAETIVRPEIRADIREVIAQYEVSAIYSDKRGEAMDGLKALLLKTLEPRGINLEEVLLRNVILPDNLANSIQEKLQADQEQQRYDFVLQKEKKEAERKRIEAEGQRDAQRTINESLTPNYLNYLYIQGLKDRQGTIYVPTNPDTGIPLFKGITP
jgi:regulator of protease activity HflC (stomatin/prohibitin superfamily)/uncharacterized membrane protein